MNIPTGVAILFILSLAILFVQYAGVIAYDLFIRDTDLAPAYTPEVKGGKTANNTASSDEIKDWQTYRNEDYGFEVKYPAGWQLYQTYTLRGRCILPGASIEPMPPDSSQSNNILCGWEVQSGSMPEGSTWAITAWKDKESAEQEGIVSAGRIRGNAPAFTIETFTANDDRNFRYFLDSFRIFGTKF